MNWWFRVLMEAYQIKERGQTPISRWIIQQTPLPLPPMLCFHQTNVSFEICFSIWREANWDKATCFEWKCRWEIDHRLMEQQCSAITGNWLQIGRQLNFQSETSINLVNISASSSYIPMINTISNAHRLNCISPSIPFLINLWNLVLVTHSVREFDGYR